MKYRYCHQQIRRSILKRSFNRRFRRAGGFTLIELLVVIAIIAILASLIFPITGALDKKKKMAVAQAELSQVETAIESYKAKMGSYPPDNPINLVLNPLYFELVGTTRNGSVYRTLDGGAQVTAPTDLQLIFGSGSPIQGFVNSGSGAGGDEKQAVPRFINNLRPAQTGQMTNSAGERMNALLLCSVAWTGPQAPVATDPSWNPWRYNSSHPTNNPASFDLWVDLYIGGKTYTVGNWKR